MRIVIRLEMTITIDVVDDVEKSTNPLENHSAVECDHCGWTGLYSSLGNARKGLAAHKRHCRKANSAVKQKFEQIIAK